MSKVYHITDEKFGSRDGVFPDDYTLVAEVPTDELEDVYRLTNSVESSWTINKELEVFGHSHRSTSVGDIVENDNGVFMVDIVGFKEVEREEDDEN